MARCEHPDIPYTVSYPNGWFVHPPDAERQIPPCAYFGPAPFELSPDRRGQLAGHSVIVVLNRACMEYEEAPISRRDLVIDAFPAWVAEVGPGFTQGIYHYVLNLTPDVPCHVAARQIVVETRPERPGAYEDNKRVVDQMATSLDVLEE